MDLSISLLYDVPGALSAPLGFIDKLREAEDCDEIMWKQGTLDERYHMNRVREVQNIEHGMTAVQITQKGLEYLDQYMSDVPSVIGYEIPLAIDHIGHIGLTECRSEEHTSELQSQR